MAVVPVVARLLLSALCAAVMLGCGASQRPQQGQSSACIDGLVWHGRTYRPVATSRALPPALRRYRIFFPGCHDASGERETGHTVPLLVLKGIPASVAVGAKAPPELYFTRDSLPGL